MTVTLTVMTSASHAEVTVLSELSYAYSLQGHRRATLAVILVVRLFRLYSGTRLFGSFVERAFL